MSRVDRVPGTPKYTNVQHTVGTPQALQVQDDRLVLPATGEEPAMVFCQKSPTDETWRPMPVAQPRLFTRHVDDDHRFIPASALNSQGEVPADAVPAAPEHLTPFDHVSNEQTTPKKTTYHEDQYTIGVQKPADGGWILFSNEMQRDVTIPMEHPPKVHNNALLGIGDIGFQGPSLGGAVDGVRRFIHRHSPDVSGYLTGGWL